MRQIGTLLLMASDRLEAPMPDTPDPLDRVARVLLGLIPTVEANRVSSYLLTMARSILMLNRFVEPLRGRPLYFDVRALFEEATAISLDTYFALLWGSLSRFASPDRMKNSNNLADFFIPPTWFSATKVPKEQVDRFFSEVAATPDELAERIAKEKPTSNDFVLLRDKPLLNDTLGFLPVDYDYLSEKFFSGPFWRVNFHLPPDQRANFHSFWGDVFEDYINWLLQISCSGKTNRFYKDPRYASNPDEQVCDGIIMCDRTAILIEYKGNTFRSTSKYGGKVEELKKELEEKLVVGTPGRKKGILQLASSVERLCRANNPDSIVGVDLSFVGTIFPLLVIRDDIANTLGMGTYLNSRFQQLKPKRLLRSVSPLFCLSANGLEHLTPYLRDVPLDRILSNWYRQDKNLMLPLWMQDNKALDNKDDRKPEIVILALEWLRDRSMDVLGLEPLVMRNE